MFIQICLYFGLICIGLGFVCLALHLLGKKIVEWRKRKEEIADVEAERRAGAAERFEGLVKLCGNTGDDAK